MRSLLLVTLVLAQAAWAADPQFVIGSRNLDLANGARALLAGRHQEGIRLTLLGLEAANDKREEEIALSNLCAGYTNMGAYRAALKYCDILLQRDDKSWRAHNSKTLVYLFTKQYDKAERSLLAAEAINPGARSVKIARALFLDATQPVAPEIEIDDRDPDRLRIPPGNG